MRKPADKPTPALSDGLPEGERKSLPLSEEQQSRVSESDEERRVYNERQAGSRGFGGRLGR